MECLRGTPVEKENRAGGVRVINRVICSFLRIQHSAAGSVNWSHYLPIDSPVSTLVVGGCGCHPAVVILSEALNT